MQLIKPPVLKPGDTIMIISTARKVSLTELQFTINKLTEWGLKVRLGKNLFEAENQYAGSDEHRAEDLQTALNDKEVNAVLFARGGYGTVRIIDKIDFTSFQAHPKWLIGYSDITVLHAHVQQNFGIATMHAPMAFNYDKLDESILEKIKAELFTGTQFFQIPASNENRNGKVKGILTGGNLSILYSLLASKSDCNTAGKILFLEDLDEYLYHIDRMMLALKRSGKLHNLAGLVIGGMSDMKDNTIPFGKTAIEIIQDAVKEYNYPVCFDFPAGHIPNNQPLIFCDFVELDCAYQVILKSVAEHGNA